MARPQSCDLGRPSLDTQPELVDVYFRYVHDKPHTLFHEPTLRKAVRDGTVSDAILHGTLGLGAR